MRLVIFFLLCTLRLYAYEFEISIATMFRDEAPYLKEWIEFHKLIGVEHFYLYNDNSQDNFEEVLEPYIKEGVVELFNYSSKIKTKEEYLQRQQEIYLRAAKRAKGVSKWVAFIDVDEFIFPVKDKTLPKFLSDYEDYEAVAINWQIFGTSHIKQLDKNKLMIEQLVLRAKRKHVINKWVKSIVQVDFVDPTRPVKSAHVFQNLKGGITINPNRVPLNDVCDFTIPVNRIRIHHYQTRDEHFLYNVKLKRTNADAVRRKNILYKGRCSNEVKDRSILIYANDLREAVFGK